MSHLSLSYIEYIVSAKGTLESKPGYPLYGGNGDKILQKNVKHCKTGVTKHCKKTGMYKMNDKLSNAMKAKAHGNNLNHKHYIANE